MRCWEIRGQRELLGEDDDLMNLDPDRVCRSQECIEQEDEDLVIIVALESALKFPTSKRSYPRRFLLTAQSMMTTMTHGGRRRGGN